MNGQIDREFVMATVQVLSPISVTGRNREYEGQVV